MEVRAGWATDYGHIKYDVSTDETDLARILISSGVSVAFHAKVTAEEAWVILDAEARWLAEHGLARHLGAQPAGEVAQERARGARRDRDHAVGNLVKRLGLARKEPDGNPAVSQPGGGSD